MSKFNLFMRNAPLGHVGKRIQRPDKKPMLDYFRCLTTAVLMVAPLPAIAAVQSVVAVPSAWRLENYSGNNVVVWGAPAPGCANLSFSAEWTGDDRNRFWSTITTGKAANRQVFVYYESTTCKIVSFGLLET